MDCDFKCGFEVKALVVVGMAIVSFGIALALIPIIPKGFIPKLDGGKKHYALPGFFIQNNALCQVLIYSRQLTKLLAVRRI
jgi:hypothetical protein